MLLRYSFAILFASGLVGACSEDEPGGGNTSGAGGTQAGSPATGGSTTAGNGPTGGNGTPGGSSTGGTGGAAAGSPGAGSGGFSAGADGGGMAGSAGSGGAPSGGAGAAGAAGNAGAGGGSATMSFFVTSKGGDKGGNFGGLDGADAFCKSLAAAVSAELGNKDWRAYLSTSTVNARDRIGPGPWRNQAGRIIANNLDDLHSQAEADGKLNSTWPIGSLEIALDEKGGQVPNDVHDILTGTGEGGKAVANMTCGDWMSAEGTDQGQVGHSNRMGGGKAPSWTTTHAVGCAPSAQNRQANTVTQGGGRGSIYCFAKGG